MTFLEVLNLTRNRINETDEDSQIDIIIKNAVNYAYLMIASKIDTKTKTANLSVSGTIKLPVDFASVVEIFSGSRPLSKLDYDLVSDLLIIRSSDVTGSLSLVYVYYPNKLVNDNDVLEIKDFYAIATSIYAAYMYYTYKEKMEIANLLYNEFNGLINMKNEAVK